MTSNNKAVELNLLKMIKRLFQFEEELYRKVSAIKTKLIEVEPIPAYFKRNPSIGTSMAIPLPAEKCPRGIKS